MAALAVSVSSWIPEDDLLLKNAVEAGASLEALAKGAVRFSRKFTLGELQDRWHSLLYDPVISAEASARILEFELSASNNQLKSIKSGVSVGNVEGTSKRKADSVRKLYYALRKRNCIQHLNSRNPNFLGSPNISDGIKDGTAAQDHLKIHQLDSDGRTMLGDCVQNNFEFQEMGVDLLHRGPEDNSLVKESMEHAVYDGEHMHEDSANFLRESSTEFGNCLGAEAMEPSNLLSGGDAPYHSVGYASPQCRTPLWKTIEDVSAPAMPINMGQMSHLDEGQGLEDTFMLPDDMDMKQISLSANRESDFLDLPDSLLNLGNDDELCFLDADGKDSINNSCHNNINPILLSSPKGIHEDDISDVKEPETCLVIPDGSSHKELEVIAEQSQPSHGNQNDNFIAEQSLSSHGNQNDNFIAEQSHSSHGNQNGNFCSVVNSPALISMLNPHSHDHVNGECTLNAEDPEIPCNDDFIPLRVVPALALQTNYKESGFTASSIAAWKDGEQNRSIMKRLDGTAQSFTASQARRHDIFPGTSYNHPLSGVKSKSLVVNCPGGVHRETTHADLSQCRSALAAQNSVKHAGLKEGSLQASCATGVLFHANSTTTTHVFPNPEANTSTLDSELSEDSEESENDDHIPYFSDIESMILDLDLCPESLDTHFSTSVSGYQNDDAKRIIIRLEQCAQASMRRGIAYQGAFALLYGRHLKHYIKKTEVTLGRATEDFDVDIDLGREGRANKISRRQALIKMEGDGSFVLLNVGKNPIFLNGNEISAGRGHSLSSSSLIEIREMAFMFEINHECVRRYLENASKRNLETNTNFQWSEEGFHDPKKP